METAKDITDNLIQRAKNLQEFTVFRNLETIPLKGVIPFSIQHTVGYPVEFTVPAISQDEAEQRVDMWLEENEDD